MAAAAAAAAAVNQLTPDCRDFRCNCRKNEGAGNDHHFHTCLAEAGAKEAGPLPRRPNGVDCGQRVHSRHFYYGKCRLGSRLASNAQPGMTKMEGRMKWQV